MARENQGLQIALIVFVMLAIVLGVTTFLFYRKYDESFRNAEDNMKMTAKAQADQKQAESDCKDLKRMMGFPESKAIADIRTQFEGDMKLCGSWNEEVRYYHPILHQLLDAVKSRDGKLEDANKKLADAQDEILRTKASIDTQVEEFKTKMNESGSKVVEVIKQAKDDQSKMVAQKNELAADRDKIRKQAGEDLKQAQSDVQNISKKMQLTDNKLRAAQKKLTTYARNVPDVFSGEVRWVNQYNGTVWINLGRADGLEPQLTFSVYSGDTENLAKATRKASIEVTQVTADHMAERASWKTRIPIRSCPATRFSRRCGPPASIGTSRWPASSI